jgi:hypothetical protein
MSGAIMKFNAATGAYQGYVGWMNTHGTSGASGCATLSGQVTPGWCVGGTFTQQNAHTFPGSVNNPIAMVVLNIGATPYLYVLHTDNNGTISIYNLATGVFENLLTQTFNMISPSAMTTDGTYLYVADGSRVVQLDPSAGTLDGWIGKVATPPTLDPSSTGCTSLSINANTAGWCLGGSSKYGTEQQAFSGVSAIAFDGAGNLIVGGSKGDGNSSSNTYEAYSYGDPSIKMFSSTTGTFEGALGFQPVKNTQWSNNTQDLAQFSGVDDYSMDNPLGVYNDGTYLYVVETKASRIKKILLATGQTVGWLGGITTSPTGGQQVACTGASPMNISPGWCLGALPQPSYLWNVEIPQTTVGMMQNPVAITGDGTYLYVTDWSLWRVQKWRASDGAYFGWTGGIKAGSSPTSNGTGQTGYTCNGATGFTPGWCNDGFPQAGTGDGMLGNPSGITYSTNGNIYVIDYSNQRVVSFNATTGTYIGWIGGVSTAPTGGCTTSTNASGNVVSSNPVISGPNWCTGGTATNKGACNAPDKGGGFYFIEQRQGITTDNTYLYIANGYNARIDAWTMNGQFAGGASTNVLSYTSTFTTNTTTLAGYAVCNSYVKGIWTDGHNLYGATQLNNDTNAGVVFKMNLTNASLTSNGTMVGWKGAILTTPTGGGANCAGASGVTPNWCQGGLGNYGLTLGGFTASSFISGDAGAGGYIYVTDEATGRLTRLPK